MRNRYDIERERLVLREKRTKKEVQHVQEHEQMYCPQLEESAVVSRDFEADLLYNAKVSLLHPMVVPSSTASCPCPAPPALLFFPLRLLISASHDYSCSPSSTRTPL